MSRLRTFTFVCILLSATFSYYQSSNRFSFCASNRYLCFAYYTLSIKLRKIIKISVKKFWRFNSYRNSFLIHLKLSLRRCTDTLIYCAIRLWDTNHRSWNKRVCRAFSRKLPIISLRYYLKNSCIIFAKYKLKRS